MIKNALLSVSDKTGIVDFAKGLVDLGVTIYSTGGTLKSDYRCGRFCKCCRVFDRFSRNDGWPSKNFTS